MLILDIAIIERLETITEGLVDNGFRYAAVFAREEGVIRRHACSGDPLWLIASDDDPDRHRFRSLELQDHARNIGLLCVHPVDADRGKVEELGATALAQVLPIVTKAMEDERADLRLRERARRRPGDWGSRELPRSRDPAHSSRSPRRGAR